MNKILIFPTDTVYGIGASVFDSKSIDRIYEIKHRDKSKPLAVLCASLSQIDAIAYVNDFARILIDKYLPGALTIILKSKKKLKESMGLDYVGVRIPNCKIALDILNEYGPMATTSVNDSGTPPINEYESIVQKYSDLVDRIYPSNIKSSNIASTVIMIANDEVKLIREGQISFDEILKLK